jgi:hypothetical protein
MFIRVSSLPCVRACVHVWGALLPSLLRCPLLSVVHVSLLCFHVLRSLVAVGLLLCLVVSVGSSLCSWAEICLKVFSSIVGRFLGFISLPFPDRFTSACFSLTYIMGSYYFQLFS